jgi:hypothetical protein
MPKRFILFYSNPQAFNASIQPFKVHKPKLSFHVSQSLELSVKVRNLEGSSALCLFSLSSGITSSYTLSPTSCAVSIDRDSLPLTANVVSLDPPSFLLANFVIDSLHFAKLSSVTTTRRRDEVSLSTSARITTQPITDSYLKILGHIFHRKYVLSSTYNIASLSERLSLMLRMLVSRLILIRSRLY